LRFHISYVPKHNIFHSLWESRFVFSFWNASMWVFWNVRNDCIFNNGVPTSDDMVDRITMLSWKWFVGRVAKGPFLLYEWKWSPLDCMTRWWLGVGGWRVSLFFLLPAASVRVCSFTQKFGLSGSGLWPAILKGQPGSRNPKKHIFFNLVNIWNGSVFPPLLCNLPIQSHNCWNLPDSFSFTLNTHYFPYSLLYSLLLVFSVSNHYKKQPVEFNPFPNDFKFCWKLF
jgi:hypothetical protein